MLKIKDLTVNVENKQILKGLNLEVNAGEIHAIMGPNGAGKSTLSHVLSGKAGYEVTGGSVTFNGKDLLEMPAEIRAREGVFLAFQYPVEIAGVTNVYLLKAALNAVRKHKGLSEVDAMDFLTLVKGKVKLLQMDEKALLSVRNLGQKSMEEVYSDLIQYEIELEEKNAALEDSQQFISSAALDGSRAAVERKSNAKPSHATASRIGSR